MQVKLINVRISFPEIFTPSSFNGGDPAYSAQFLIEADDPQLKTLRAAIDQLAKEKWKDKAPMMLKTLQAKDNIFLHDGDLKAKYAGYAGNFYVSARSAKRPLVVDADRTPLTQADGKPYSGCYVNAILELWTQDNGYGQRINASLGGVQFVKDGEAFSGGAAVGADAFDDISMGAEDLI